MNATQSIRRDSAAANQSGYRGDWSKRNYFKTNQCYRGVVRLVNTTLVELAAFEYVRDYSKVSTD
jgi:hypothetical protein